jgi:hypothetical protein
MLGQGRSHSVYRSLFALHPRRDYSLRHLHRALADPVASQVFAPLSALLIGTHHPESGRRWWENDHPSLCLFPLVLS